jgi:hypothetical protein
MQKLTRSDLWSLEQYAEQRTDFRRKVLAHKRHRQVALGEHVRLYFEDRLTIQYQVQEMLRIERVFEPAGIQEELDGYNPLIPDGSNWKATLMIEYEDSEQRKAELERLVGLEHRVWVRIGSGEPIYAIADEDLDRATADKTSAVHFLRFELPEVARAGVHQGADVSVGIDLPAYRIAGVTMAPEVVASLRADLDPIGQS